MAIFHLSIRPISRAKGHSAVAQIAYDPRCKLTNERTGEKHDWSKHKADVLDWQVIGPTIEPAELAARGGAGRETLGRAGWARDGRGRAARAEHQGAVGACPRIRPATSRYLRRRFVRESPSSKCQGRRPQRSRSPFHDNPSRGRGRQFFKIENS